MNMLLVMVLRLSRVFDRDLFLEVVEVLMLRFSIFVDSCLVVSLKVFWVWVLDLKNRFIIVCLCNRGIFLMVCLFILINELVVLRILVSSLWLRLLSVRKWCNCFFWVSCRWFGEGLFVVMGCLCVVLGFCC